MHRNHLPHASRRQAFSLIELLTVLAIIALLASILIPVVGRVQVNARKTKTRVQFNEWSSAIQAFRMEYGFYPDFSAISGNRIDSAADTTVFVETLSGRRLDGSDLQPTDPGVVAGNTKHIRFHSFSNEDLTADAQPLLQDGFGNTTIVVLMDLNQDGVVKIDSAANGGDYTTAPTVITDVSAPLATGEFVRAGVIFYSPGPGQGVDDIVTSW